jgi:hypothetical protein
MTLCLEKDNPKKGWYHMTAKEVKELLKIYYDIPQMIAEEFAAIRHCEEEKNKITVQSVKLSGMPGRQRPAWGPNGQHGAERSGKIL